MRDNSSPYYFRADEVVAEKIQMRWSWRMFRLASVHVLTLANAQAEIQQRLESRHIFVVVGATTTDQPWLRAQWEQFGIRYVPVMVQPHPVWAQPLQQMAEEMNGVFYPNVAWTADGLKKRLNVASNPLYGTGLDSIFRTRGLHDTSINATTVDIARVFRENIREDDEVVMRMDCEGSEYVLLRHLMLSGWLCKLRRLYLEAHAMSRPKLNRFRTFDVILPWLLEPCGTEVYVDTGYHNTAESLALWPKQDGVCRWCPMLYVPFQGASPRRCPAASIRQCFDATYTCERCCNVERFGPLGDLDCWRRGRPVAGSRLKSGGLGYSLPQDVLQRILDTSRDGEAILRLVGAQATPPHPAIFSYEMCCASMVGELVPGLSPFFHHQSSGEYYGADVRAQKPQAARPWAVGAAKEAARGHTSRASKEGCANFEGLYQDSGGGVVEVSQTKCNIRAKNAAQRWSMDANADGIQVFMWDVVGTLRDGFISWSNQATWVILQDAAEAEKDRKSVV